MLIDSIDAVEQAGGRRLERRVQEDTATGTLRVKYSVTLPDVGLAMLVPSLDLTTDVDTMLAMVLMQLKATIDSSDLCDIVLQRLESDLEVQAVMEQAGGVTFCSFFASELTSERFTSDSSISQQAEGADALTDDDFSAGAAAGAATVSSGDDTEATNPRLGEQESGERMLGGHQFEV